MFFRKTTVAHSIETSTSLKKQRGVSLNEFILYSGLAALAIAATLAGYQVAKQSNDFNNIADGMTRTKAQLMTQFGSGDSTGASFNNILGALPAEWKVVKATGAAAGPMTGVVFDLDKGVTDSDLSIKLSKVPKDICVKAIPMLGGGWESSSKVNTKPMINADGNIQAGAMAGSCTDDAGGAGTNTINLDFQI